MMINRKARIVPFEVSRLSDVVIIGAGPAGLFAAKELIENTEKSVRVIDSGKTVEQRRRFIEEGGDLQSESRDVMRGVGGMCLLSNGTLNLDPDIGGRLTDYVSEERAYELVEEVDLAFQNFGLSSDIYGGRTPKTDELSRKASAADVKFVPVKQKRIGLENLMEIISSFVDYLKDMGVEFHVNTEVEEIKEDEILLEDGERINSEYIIAAPGRTGASWLIQQAKELGIGIMHGPIDVGVRVEIPSVVMESVLKISRDPKFYIRTHTFDDFVRTFQINQNGYVVKERYDDVVCVNGRTSMCEQTENSNFALLTQIDLTEPVTDTSAYGESIARLATTIGGDVPVVQRLADLRNGRRSTEKRVERGHVNPTLDGVTPGDISMALPGRIVTSLQEALEQLDEVISGVASNSTLLYAPEIKFYAGKIPVNGEMKTEIDNLYVTGDGAGPVHDIVNSSVTGLLSARSIKNRIN